MLPYGDANNKPRETRQGEGGEQGDPLMPALFCVALHDALQHAAASLHSGGHIFAYLHDVHLVSSRDGARAAYEHYYW